MKIEFFVRGVPVPEGSVKAFVIPGTNAARVVHADPNRLRPWRAAIANAARSLWHLAPPWRGPVTVSATFYQARSKAHYGTGRNAGILKASAPMWPTSKPDIDKLARAVLDALTAAAVFGDDAQVIGLDASKLYGEVPGVQIKLEAFE